MIRFTLSLLLAVLFCSNVYAAKYTSAQNGIYTTPSTWMGNVAPPSTLSGADTVIINHNVSFGLDITMSHPLAYIQVASNKIFGRITNQYLSITGGAVINSNGLVQADSLFINDPANKLHFNMLDARAMRVDTFVNNYTVTIFERLYIQGRYSFSSPLSFFLNSVVYMDGGEIVKTGTANFCMPNNRYDLVYRQPTLTGIELENANFKNVEGVV